MLSEAKADLPAAMPTPAVAESSSASRRVRRLRFEDLDMNALLLTHELPENQANRLIFDRSLPSCQKTSGRHSILFRQCILAVDVEIANNARRAGIGLASPYADCVISFRND